MFTVEQLSSCLSPEDLALVRAMHRGGSSANRGARYQDHYAVFRLLLAACEYLAKGTDARVWLELECAVDDVVVEVLGTGHRSFCQAKTSEATSWAARSGRLRRQFEIQRTLCDHCLEGAYELVLVTPSERRRQVLANSLPATIAERTRVEHFQLTDQIWSVGSPAEPALEVLVCAAGGLSQREAIVRYVYSHVATGKPGEALKVSAIVAALRACSLGNYLRDPGAAPPASWEGLVAALKGVPGLEVSFVDGACRYALGRFSGLIGRCDTPEFERFAERIVARPPSSFAEFRRQIP